MSLTERAGCDWCQSTDDLKEHAAGLLCPLCRSASADAARHDILSALPGSA